MGTGTIYPGGVLNSWLFRNNVSDCMSRFSSSSSLPAIEAGILFPIASPVYNARIRRHALQVSIDAAHREYAAQRLAFTATARILPARSQTPRYLNPILRVVLSGVVMSCRMASINAAMSASCPDTLRSSSVSFSDSVRCLASTILILTKARMMAILT